ncbi:three-helix bundle dimerization domain-containing protein, partial [Mycobacteroides chelonae]
MSEQALVAAVQQRLMAMYSWLPPEHVSAVVQGAHAQFVDCRVREFV